MNPTSPSSPSTSRAIASDTGVALGLGLTNACNLSCAFCYHGCRNGGHHLRGGDRTKFTCE